MVSALQCGKGKYEMNDGHQNNLISDYLCLRYCFEIQECVAVYEVIIPFFLASVASSAFPTRGPLTGWACVQQ